MSAGDEVRRELRERAAHSLFTIADLEVGRTSRECPAPHVDMRGVALGVSTPSEYSVDDSELIENIMLSITVHAQDIRRMYILPDDMLVLVRMPNDPTMVRLLPELRTRGSEFYIQFEIDTNR